MITAELVRDGCSFRVRIANGEAFDLTATDASTGALLWKARLSTPYYCVGEASIRSLEGARLEVRALAIHVKDDSSHEFVWRYSADGVLEEAT